MYVGAGTSLQKFIHSLLLQIETLQNVPIVFFCKHDDLCVINKVSGGGAYIATW